uniref:Rab-GAP TBC domain-containing protein n=1 Tax=Pseudo-nitzschia australis TaxID=44445 RepID=A0A7S4ASG3_9STRA|mmetsp:Transcript_13676/g.28675  ORF Transcript_13676/g.28675 Transcript_13676/m.28675 type:complete len:559 (-) Transcript_13676:357-2033(-)|eukprot:CAMPEP_0168179426 /NCGR_PEP_ID=MMETSP0139_2-20121125/9842_1 /TAXON_ID=44445 /ORGANISM="Pseudo-nitzschia australis, Strain 10249 10 AB" /LENGTH=558 /DNA_ID=CAMNT_0008099265 /DNA_START=192 /DNA_END=1868 /DNA_ORIENTATION=+
MTTRGLPGFLRRSLRRDDFYTTSEDDDTDDNDNDDDDGENSIEDSMHNTESPSNRPSATQLKDRNNTNTKKQQKTAALRTTPSGAATDSSSSSLLDPSPLAETSAREDANAGWTHTNNPSTNNSSSNNTNNNMNMNTNTKMNGNGDFYHDNDGQNSVSTLGESVSGIRRMSGNSSYESGNSNNNSNSSSNHRGATSRRSPTKSYRETQFEKILGVATGANINNSNHNNSNKNNHVVKMSELRQLAWNGIPPQYRGMSWKIMLGYLPTNAMRRQQTLERKRAEYKDAIQQHYYIDDNSRTIQEQETLRQVLVDVPRTAPDIQLFRNEKIKRALSRLLYIWAMRHPASSYVQGINDLATPLFAVFLAEEYEGEDMLDGSIMVVLEDERIDEVEADVYWCLTNILAGIQDHYTEDQPGVQRMVMRLEELVNRIDGDLYNHIHSVGIQFMQFAFKWMNCLLLREFNLRCVVRLWDTYISEESGNGFEDFHVYVCAAFLSQFSSQLQEMDFDELFQFMQQVPTDDWGETEIEMLLSHAYVLRSLFEGSDAHLTSNSNLNNSNA